MKKNIKEDGSTCFEILFGAIAWIIVSALVFFILINL